MHGYIFMAMHVWLCVHGYVCMLIWLSICLGIAMYVCLYGYVYGYVCKFVWLCMYVCMAMYVCLYGYVCMAMYGEPNGEADSKMA